MYIISLDPVFGKKNKYKVRLDDGADFVLYKKEIERYNLYPEKEITPKEYAQILEDVFIPRAKIRAMHLLVKQDRTESGLRKKLRENGYPREAIDAAIGYVAGYGYIDDTRYVCNYIRTHNSQKSKKRILYDLENKGIQKSIIVNAIALLEEDMETVFDDGAVLREKFKNISREELEDEKYLKRLVNRFLQRGFGYEDIKEAINGTRKGS